MKKAAIQLFGEIGRDVTSRDFHEQLSSLDVDEIVVDIHSEGGGIAEGFHFYHLLLSHRARIVVQIPSLAASMAGIVAMAADEIRMAANAFIVLHNPFFQLLGGEAKDLRHAADLLDAFKANAVRAYRRHSPLADDDVSALMDAETWLSAEEALEKGFAHVVTDRMKAVNRFDLSRFRRVPPAAQALILNPSGGPMDKRTESNEPPSGGGEELTDTPETPESLWSRLGQMLLGRGAAAPGKDRPAEGVLSQTEAAAVLAIERQALRGDRARLAVDRDLASHRDAIEPAQLETLEPILLKLKTAELDGDGDAASQYSSLTALLPSLASPKTGGELAGSDQGALTATLDVSLERKSIDARMGITDERREFLMKKYPGCRPGAVRVL